MYGLVHQDCAIYLINFQSLLYLPAGPTRTKTVIWKKPWFTEREQSEYMFVLDMVQWLTSIVIMVNRLLRDDVSKGQTPTRAHVSFRDIWNALRDPSMLGLWIIGLLGYIPKAPVIQYLALSLRRMGFSTLTSNVLMIPSEFLKVLGLLGLARSSEYFNERAMHCIFAELFCVPLFATLLVLPAGGFRWARFTIATLITGGPTSFAIVVNWISQNSFDVRKRAVSIAMFGMFDLVGSVAAARKCAKS